MEKVIIDDIESHKVYEFLCNRWLAEDEEDHKTYVYLRAGDTEKTTDNSVPYKISIKTGDKRNAGTSAKVYAEFFGGKSGDKSSGKIYFKNGKFEQNKIDIFEVNFPKMISPVRRVVIGHDNSGFGPGWYLDKVEVECALKGMKQVFPCKRWLSKDEDDGLIEVELFENKSLREVQKPKTVWNLNIYTSDKSNAGTDSNVKIVIYGDEGKTDEIPVKSDSDLFEKGKCDQVKIEAESVGRPFKMRVFHDNSGNAPGWHLNKIEAHNAETKETYLFRCDRWLATDEDDGEIIREMPAEGSGIEKPLSLKKYEVEVHTGSERNAGTGKFNTNFLILNI